MIGSLRSLDSRGGYPHMGVCLDMTLPVPVVADWLGICKTVLGSSI
jgi:hypothetical protein